MALGIGSERMDWFKRPPVYYGFEQVSIQLRTEDTLCKYRPSVSETSNLSPQISFRRQCNVTVLNFSEKSPKISHGEIREAVQDQPGYSHSTPTWTTPGLRLDDMVYFNVFKPRENFFEGPITFRLTCWINTFNIYTLILFVWQPKSRIKHSISVITAITLNSLLQLILSVLI